MSRAIQASSSDSSDCLAPALHQPDVRLTSDCLRSLDLGLYELSTNEKFVVGWVGGVGWVRSDN